MGKPRNPETRAEWQEAVDSAEFLLLIHSARLYGLITGGPECDVERCEEILNEGKKRRILPRKGE